MQPIFSSLLEDDLYKLTMQQALLHQCPSNTARYEFVCRNRPLFPLSRLAGQVNEQFDALCTLRFSEDELDYLRTLRFLKPDYIEFLRLFQFNRRFIEARADGDRLVIEANGPQVHVMRFEMFSLAIVSELYTRATHTPETAASMQTTLDAKIDRALERLNELETGSTPPQRPFEFFDFGLRRRSSGHWQRHVLRTLMQRMPKYFKGTSNVLLAKDLGLVAIGTMAHEFLQTFQAMPGVQLRHSIVAALDAWVREYRGDLGIALTDVVTTDAFLRDFDLFFAKLFDGLRHDSGDPIDWARKTTQRYQQLRIDPYGKRLTFSNALTLDGTAIDIFEALSCKDRHWTGFGIGTNLTNDGPVAALNLVMKLQECNGMPTAKISDDQGKTLCRHEQFLSYLRSTFDVPQ